MADLPSHVPYYDVPDDMTEPPPRRRRAPGRYAVEQPSQGFSFTNITVPILIVFLGGAGLVTATHYATSEMAGMHTTLRNIEREINTVATRIDREMDQLRSDIQWRTAHRWSKIDHDIWCAKTEAINRDNGWRCAPTTAAAHAQNAGRSVPPPIQGGWSTK